MVGKKKKRTERMSEEKTACHENLRTRNERIYNNLQILEQLGSVAEWNNPSAYVGKVGGSNPNKRQSFFFSFF